MDQTTIIAAFVAGALLGFYIFDLAMERAVFKGTAQINQNIEKLTAIVEIYSKSAGITSNQLDAQRKEYQLQELEKRKDFLHASDYEAKKVAILNS